MGSPEYETLAFWVFETLLIPELVVDVRLTLPDAERLLLNL
jgi:hypothetical protein